MQFEPKLDKAVTGFLEMSGRKIGQNIGQNDIEGVESLIKSKELRLLKDRPKS